MDIIDTIGNRTQSVTATVCENAALFGAASERNEVDTREVWVRGDPTEAVLESVRILCEGVGPDGLPFADERESLLRGFVNMLDSHTQTLDRADDKLTSELRDLQKVRDGTVIKSREMEPVTDWARNRTAKRDAFETLRAAALIPCRSEYSAALSAGASESGSRAKWQSCKAVNVIPHSRQGMRDMRIPAGVPRPCVPCRRSPWERGRPGTHRGGLASRQPSLIA